MNRFRSFYSQLEAYEEPTVNLTPLIDVLFVVLFAFMIAAPLLEYEQIELAHSALPKSSYSPLQQQATVRIYVLADDSILIDKKPIALASLPQHLLLLRQGAPASPRLQLFHDKKATFGTYQSIKTAAEKAGFSEIELFLANG